MNLSKVRMCTSLLVVGLLTGCGAAASPVGTSRVTAASPTATPRATPTLQVQAMSFEDLLLELRAWFVNDYCPVRGTPAAKTALPEGLRIHQELVERAKAQGVTLAPFNPDDPARCK